MVASFSEARMTPDAIKAARYIMGKYPQIQTIGGWRPYDRYPDHPSGRAIDIMIPDYANNVALGNAIRDDLHANFTAFGGVYTIWNQEYWGNDGRNIMEDRGSDTQNHRDHVHLTVEGNSGTGNPTGGAQNIIGGGTVASVSDAMKATAEAVKNLGNKDFWLRVLKGIAGAGLLLLGVYNLLGSQIIGGTLALLGGGPGEAANSALETASKVGLNG